MSRSTQRFGRPVPTSLAFALVAAGLLPAVLSVVHVSFLWASLLFDTAIIAACAVDFLLSPAPSSLSASREVEPVLSSAVAAPVTLRLTAQARHVRGELRDELPRTVENSGEKARFDTARDEVVRYRVTPLLRGDLRFGDLFLRVEGPLRLCARQFAIPLSQTVKVYPDLHAITRDALQLAAANENAAQRVIRRVAEGRDFESLRDYRTGDDYRTIDWKASARKARTMVRQHRPERNQVVLLLLDCGRHMAGTVAKRRKLDHAIDAALRLARVSLERGDKVGALAFATTVKAHVPPQSGVAGLRALTAALYQVEASLEESDYGEAVERAFARQHRRALVVAFTDLLDLDTSKTVLQRMLSLRPRHLPMVASLLDEELLHAARAVPLLPQDAYVRQTAARLEDEYQRTAAQLRDAGVIVVRSAPGAFSAAAVNEYLRVKARGLL